MKFRLLILSACALLSAAGAYIGYQVMSTPLDLEALRAYEPAVYVSTVEVSKEDGTKVRPDTSIVYQHFDETSGYTHEVATDAPTFMLQKTQTDLESIFNEWDILSFSQEQVVMRRNIASLPEVEYTISEIAGFITIFHGNKEDGNIKEMTQITIGHLHESEQQRLKRGIPILNKDELIRRLEDYSS